MTDAGCAFWNREIQAPTYTEWMGIPAVRDRINGRIGGAEPRWPLDWFAATYPGLRFERALSIGCGAGALERDLVARGLCGAIDAFDGSVASLAVARRAARGAGLGAAIRYFAADFNEPAFPVAVYDAVFVHQALHHVAKLEKLLRAVLRSLKPGGLFYLEEYVGPSRDDWGPERMRPLEAIYAALPREFRRYDALAAPIQMDDPSEAIRSGEIRGQLAVGFDVEHDRGYGGNVLAVVLPSLDLERAGEATVSRLCEEEDRRLAAGEPDFYSVMVARPHRGARGSLASLRYWAEPKLKRIGRELRARFGG